MTLILGARCSDGVTIIADTKITGHEGTFFGHEPKLYGELTNTIFGCAGSKNMVQLFRRYVLGDVKALTDSKDLKYTDLNLIDKLSEVMKFFTEVRDGFDYLLTVMIARIVSGSADLHIVDSLGRIDHDFTKPWKAIGTGAGDANYIVDREWRDSMSMNEFASMSYSVIKYIEKQNPNGKVGIGSGKPNIKYLPQGSNSDIDPFNEEWINFENSYPIYESQFRKHVQ